MKKLLLATLLFPFLVQADPITGPAENDNTTQYQYQANVLPRGEYNAGLEAEVYIGASLVASDACDAGTTASIITAAAHSARKGDIIRFTSGTYDDVEARVVAVATNTITISPELLGAPAALDTFDILRPRTLLTDASGNPQIELPNLEKAEDAPHTSGDTGVLGIGIYSTTPASSTSTGGDYAASIQGPLGQYVDPVGTTTRVCVAITPDTSAYAANDIVGGKLTFASLLRTSVNSGTLQNISVTNTEIDGIGYDLCLFNADPTGSTVADQGALTVVAADLQKWIDCVDISDQKTGATTELYKANSLGVAVDASATSLYAVLRTKGAPTWAAAQTVNVCLTVLND